MFCLGRGVKRCLQNNKKVNGFSKPNSELGPNPLGQVTKRDQVSSG
jgi:hypothetical protein